MRNKVTPIWPGNKPDLETVAEPDMIRCGDYGELLAVRFYPSTPLAGKHLVVAYVEGFCRYRLSFPAELEHLLG